jgi:uncharacterized protein (TIGR02118 family)
VIKLVFCLRRRPEYSVEEFQTYWREKHAPLVRQMAPALGIRRYTQCHSFSDPRLASSAKARQCVVEPYDGVAELWWESLDELMRIASRRESREAGRMLLEDEHRFIDLQNSPLFFTEEHDLYVA